MKIAVVGAGVGGLSAAHDFLKAGHKVKIFESASYVGGLAAGIKEPHWQWSMEQYYHHWFTSDSEMMGLIRELGWWDKIVERVPVSVAYHNGRFYPLDSPLAALKFPGFTLFDKARFGIVSALLRYILSWKPLEAFTADEWLRRYYGQRLYDILFEPLLVGKFDTHYKDVNLAWFWARIKTRTTHLRTFEGGFQAFCDMFAENLRQRGAEIALSTPVEKIVPLPQGGISVEVGGQSESFDQCLVTVSPSLLARLCPALPPDYLKGLLDLKSMGAVVLILSLKQQLSKEGYYWYSLPKSAGFPFLALVEHTNFLSPEYFGGDHLLYCGDYLDVDHEYFSLSKEELVQRFIPGIQRINPDFKADWIRNSWLFKTRYAQPIPLVNHSRNIPSIRTPIQGLYFASMSQVYPWDRGTNFAVQIARKTSRLMLEELVKS